MCDNMGGAYAGCHTTLCNHVHKHSPGEKKAMILHVMGENASNLSTSSLKSWSLRQKLSVVIHHYFITIKLRILNVRKSFLHSTSCRHWPLQTTVQWDVSLQYSVLHSILMSDTHSILGANSDHRSLIIMQPTWKHVPFSLFKPLSLHTFSHSIVTPYANTGTYSLFNIQ